MTTSPLELGPAPWTLRPYQMQAVKEVARAWQSLDEEGNPRNRTLVVMATGTGKTTVFSEILRRRHMAGRKRALVLAHRIELLKQAAERIRLGGLGAHLESGDYLAPLHAFSTLEPADVVVATVQTMRGRRLERWDPDTFDTIIVDEGHHATSASYRAVLDRFSQAKILLVTATPDRDDGVGIGNVCNHLAFEYNLRDGIADGFLAPLKILGLDLPIDLSKVRITKQEQGRDYSADDLGAQMETKAMLDAIAVPLLRESDGRSTLVFVPSVAVAHKLAERVASYIDPKAVDSLDGSSTPEERKDALDRYQSGATRILINCALFTEGFDAPHTSCVCVARPTKSRALYAQMIGRGTRLSPGKTECLILDMAPGNARHQLVAPVDLLIGDGLDEDIVKEMREKMSRDDVMEVVKRGEEIAEARARERARDRQRAEKLDLSKARVQYAKRERDPFEELGIDGEVGRESGPRATSSMMEAIARSGLSITTRSPSIGEAKKILDALAKRRADGLCTIKQTRLLGRFGLRKDLTFDQAREALDMIAANNWQVSPEIAEKYGAEE